MPPSTADVVLQTEGLTQHYGSLTALDDLSITVHGGEVFGYIGPNGAGKTTTFRILSGLMSPTSGRAVIGGVDVTADRDLIKRMVGFLPDNFGVYPTLRVWEYLDFFAAAYRIPSKQRAARIDVCLQLAGAGEFRDKLMGALSRGMKQRVGIAKTLLHDPKVIILDEPAATLDPHARLQVRGMLRELAALGKAILVSSHILPELADICDTVGILKSGKLVACGPVRQIMRTVRQKRIIEISVLRSRAKAADILGAAPGEWTRIETRGDDGLLRYEVDADDTQLAGALRLLVEQNVELIGFNEVPASLEEAFVSLTAK